MVCEFRKRHNTAFSMGRAHKRKYHQAAAATRENLDSFYSLLKERVETLGLQADQIWNAGENGFSRLGVGKGKVAVPASVQASPALASDWEQHVTLLAAIRADGFSRQCSFSRALRVSWPVRTGSKAAHQARSTLRQVWCRREPPLLNHVRFGARAYMTQATFAAWLKAFVEFTKPTAAKTVLLILDNHSSRMDLDALDIALQNHVHTHTHILLLSPNLTHLLQPADCIVFASVNKEMDALAGDSCARGIAIAKNNVAGLIYKAFMKGCKPSNVVSAFAKTGVWPMDRLAVPDSELSLGSSVAGRSQPLPELQRWRRICSRFPWSSSTCLRRARRSPRQRRRLRSQQPRWSSRRTLLLRQSLPTRAT